MATPVSAALLVGAGRYLGDDTGHSASARRVLAYAKAV